MPVSLILAGIVFLISGGTILHQTIIAPRRWMRRHGNGNEHGDRKAVHFFARRYRTNQLLESYGENPLGKDKS